MKTREPRGELLDLVAQRLERPMIRRGARTEHGIIGRRGGQHMQSYEFAQPPFQAIARDSGMLVARHDEPHAWKRKKGSGGTRLDGRAAHSLPFQSDLFEFSPARQSLCAREGSGLRRPRTSTGA